MQNWVGVRRSCRKGGGVQTDSQSVRQTDRQTERQTDRHTDRQTDSQTDRQTDRQTDIHTHKGTLQLYIVYGHQIVICMHPIESGIMFTPLDKHVNTVFQRSLTHVNMNDEHF